MRIVIVGVFYKGEPVYREWSQDRTEVSFFSRETQRFAKGGFKFIRWVPLKKIKIPTGLPELERMRRVYAAQHQLLSREGVNEAV